jgi:hypothetical protein
VHKGDALLRMGTTTILSDTDKVWSTVEDDEFGVSTPTFLV